MDTQALSYTLDNCGDLNTDVTGIDTIYIYAHTDSNTLAATYAALTPVDTLTKAQAQLCGSPAGGFGGLTAGTKYYLGVATHNTFGLSDSIHIRMYWTHPKNPLRLSVAETPLKPDSGVVITISNINALSAAVDTIKLFYPPLSNYQTNPQYDPPDTAFSRSQLTGDEVAVTDPRGFEGLRKYYFTITCGITSNPQPATRWGYIHTSHAEAVPPGNADTLRTSDYSNPGNTLDIQLNTITTTSVNFTLTGTPVSNVESVYVYISMDSTELAGQYRTLSPCTTLSRDAFAGPHLIDTLHAGGLYFLGVTVKSSQKFWSNSVHIKRVEATVDNPVSLSLSRLPADPDRIVVTFGNLGSVLPSATNLHLFYRTGDYQTDPSQTPQVDYPKPFPASDTIYFAPPTSDLYYFSVSPGYTGNWGPIGSLNEARIFVDNVSPSNLLSIGVSDSTASSFTVNLSGTMSPDVDSVWVYVNTDSAALMNNYKNPATAYARVHKTALTGISVTGLSEAAMYWIGAAVKDTLGNWSSTVQLKKQFTALNNPLSLAISAAAQARVLNVTYNGLGGLAPRVDTVRLFYKTGVAVFNPVTYGADLKRSEWKAALLVNNTVQVTNMLSRTTYYFAVNEKYFDAATGTHHFGPISGPNIDTFVTPDWEVPLNIGLTITDSSVSTLSYRLNSPSLLEPDIKSVYVYCGTTLSAIRSGFRTMAAVDTLTRAEALVSGTLVIGGLADATRYFVCVAVEDSSGNWVDSANITVDSCRTRISNPLTVSLSISPSDNRNVLMVINNLAGLNPVIDSLRVFWKSTLVADPFSAIPDTVVPRDSLSAGIDTLTLRMPDAYMQRLVFSVSPGLKTAGNRLYYAAMSPSNSDTITVDTDEPPNPLTLWTQDSTLASITVRIGDWQTLWSTDVKYIYLWAHKDSGQLRAGFRTMPESVAVPLRDSLEYSHWPRIRGLDTGTVYFIGAAPRDTNGNFSAGPAGIVIRRMRTAAPPLNPLSISAASFRYSSADVRIQNISLLAPEVDRSRVRLFYRTGAYNTDPYSTTGFVSLNLSSSGPADTVTINPPLQQETTYFLTVSVCNSRGYYSAITAAHGCTVTTPKASDTLPPDGSVLTFEADSLTVVPLTQLGYKVRGLNGLTGPDRDSSVVRVCWSATEPNLDFWNPPPGVGVQDFNLWDPAFHTADTLDGAAYGLLPGNMISNQGRPYYFTMCVRDSEFNWDTGSIRTDTAYTRVDTVRPRNDTLWDVSQSNFKDLVINWHPSFFNQDPGFRDTVPAIGVWVSLDTLRQGVIDSTSPSFFMPCTNGVGTTPFMQTVLQHNRRYHVAMSPFNTIGNRGAIVNGKSYFRLSVPFDSSTIPVTPNLCTLRITHVTAAPESLRLHFSLGGTSYPDPVNGITVNITSVLVYYKGEGSTDSILAWAFPVSSGTDTGGRVIGGLPPDSTLVFTAFCVNQLSPAFPKRQSAGSAAASDTVTTYGYPENHLWINSLTALGGFSAPDTILVDWSWNSLLPPPEQIKFLYANYRFPNDTPAVHYESRYSVSDPILGKISGITTITSGVRHTTPYVVAGFVMSPEGVWSKTCVWDTVKTKPGSDTLRPQTLPFVLSAQVLDCRNVRLNWTVDTASLRSVLNAENGDLSLGYGYRTASQGGWDYFITPIEPNPYQYAIPVESLFTVRSAVMEVDPNAELYFALALIDSANNAAPADSPVSLATAITAVPPLDSDSVLIEIPTNTVFSVDWRKALDSGNGYAADGNVLFLSLVASNAGYYTGVLPSDTFFTRNDTVFLCSTYTVAEGVKALSSLSLDSATYYLSAYVSVYRSAAGASLPTRLGTLHYNLDKPHLDLLVMEQVSDTLERVAFVPRDLTEDSLRVTTRFAISQPSASDSLRRSALLPGYVQLNDAVLPVNVPCTAYVRLNAPEMGPLSGRDTAQLVLRLSLSDRMPVSQMTEDASVIVMNTVDRLPPSFVTMTVNYNRLTKALTCILSSSRSGDLDSIAWGVDSLSLDSGRAYGNPGSQTTISTVSNGLHFRLYDGFGNWKDTSWHDFEMEKRKLKDVYPPPNDSFPYTVDNNKVRITVFERTVATSTALEAYLYAGMCEPPLSPATFTLRGFDKVQPVAYWFMTQLPINENYIQDVYLDGIRVEVRYEGIVDSAMRFYRLWPNNQLEYLGGRMDASGYVVLDSFKTSVWNSTSGLPPSSEDTVRLVVGKDLLEPSIDMAKSGVALTRAPDTTVKAVLQLSDNNVYLDASLRVFTFTRRTTDTTIFDTTTTRLVPGKRGFAGTMATAVACTLDLSAEAKAFIPTVDSSGLYLALKVGDGAWKYFFNSESVGCASVKGSYASVLDRWKIVNITADVKDNSDILENLPAFGGRYDADRFRLFALAGNRFLEYRPNSPDFRLVPGRAFLLITRLPHDDNVAFETGYATSAFLKHSRGFVAAVGETGNNWKLVSLPFMGGATKAGIVNASICRQGAGRVSLDSRIWTLNESRQYSAQSFEAAPGIFPFNSAQGYSSGFLAYLYPGDTLIVPVTNMGSYAPPPVSKAGKPLLADSGCFFSRVTLADGSGRVQDDLNGFGFVSQDYTLNDLAMPGSAYEAGFTEPGGLMGFAGRKRTGKGGLWTLAVRDHSGKAADLRLLISDVAKVPRGDWLYLDDLERGFSTDLKSVSGVYPFLGPGRGERLFRIVAGDSAFVMANVHKPVPLRFDLAGNYPNPFNPVTVITFAVPDFMRGRSVSRTRLELSVYDVAGRKVARILDKPGEPGYYRVPWNGRDGRDLTVASGLYFYKLTVFDDKGNIRFQKTRKMLMIK